MRPGPSPRAPMVPCRCARGARCARCGAIDVVGAVRPAFWLGSGVLAPALRGSGLTPEAAGRLAPAVFVLIALSGVLRLNPGPVVAAGAGALLGTPPAELVPELGVLALI